MTGTGTTYRTFAHLEAHGVSPLYEELAVGVAGDPELLALLEELPPPKRQANLFFAAARWHAGVPAGFAQFRAGVLANRDAVVATMLARATQTNEAARCACLLPVLASLPQPLALIEVGASAGLCLLPDRYRYDYDGVEAGDPASPVRLSCHVTLVWPEHTARAERLRAALAIAAEAPPRIVRGDLVEELPALADLAPPGATLVVFHTAVLNYLPARRREAFADLVRGLPGHWISQEGTGVFPPVPAGVPPVVPDGPARFLLRLDERPLALTAPHGGELRWLGG